jgi:microcompartment protein CcmL/EutN
MNRTRVRAVALLAAAVVGASALAGCGDSGGGTTTTASSAPATSPDDGTVTIQTDTVVTNTAPPADTTSSSGITGNAPLDAAITAMAVALRGTVADLRASTDAAALTTAITARAQAFDRAVQQVHDVVPEDGAQTNTQDAITTAAPALSQAYRDFSDAAAQAADSNNAGALASAKSALSDALRTFDEAAGTGN